MGKSEIRPPDASRQVTFHRRLVVARKTWLIDALNETLGKTDPEAIKKDLSIHVPPDVQKILASAGIRDEYVFPTPTVLAANPRMIGYYRLLLGAPQKSFYGRATGMGAFKRMETDGHLNDDQKQALSSLCSVMTASLSELVRNITPRITARDINELPILILGSQFQGLQNTVIGKLATQQLFGVIRKIVQHWSVESTDGALTVKNAARRLVRIVLASDPDIQILEQFGGHWREKVAIEIKGGTDQSNAHNRAGEAEKSHLKAKKKGFRDFWTVITTTGLDMNRMRAESPTTTSWFDVSQLLRQEGDDRAEFNSRVLGEVGISLRRPYTRKK